MDSNIIFQKIKERITVDDKAFLLIVVCFLVVAFVRVAFGFVPWYLLLVMMPMFFASLLHPKAGLFALIFLTVLFERFFTLEAFQFGQDVIKLYPLDIVLLGMYGGVLVKILYTKMHFAPNKTNVFLSVFFVLASAYLVGSFIGFGSQDMSVAFSTWKNYVFYGMLFFTLPFLLENESDVKKVVNYFLSAVIIGIIFLLIGIVRGEGLWTEFTPLSTGGVRLLAFPHAFYFSLAFLGTFVTAEYWSRSKYRALIWFVLSIWMFGVLASLMRHMWIGMVVTLIFMWVFFLKERSQQLTKKMIAIAFSFGVFIFAFLFFISLTIPTSTVGHISLSLTETVTTRFTSIGNSADTSISWRSSTWQSAFSLLSQSPFLGLGFGVHIPVESGDYRDFVEIRNIHNSWLALLVQMGIFGFVLMSAFLFSLIIRLVRSYQSTPSLSALRIALLTIFVYQGIVFFAQPYLETNLTGIFFWLTLGLMNTLLMFSWRKDFE
ncbi:MAG: O-antigen ligase family protein [Candidatus Moraniibacteriota bacterium]